MRARAQRTGWGGGQASRRALEALLREEVSPGISLQVTDNLRTMLSLARRGDGTVVRLHHMFLHAPWEVVDALAGYLRNGDPAASSALDGYIRDNRWRIRPVPPEVRRSRIPLSPRGRFHDLQLHFDDLQGAYFSSSLDCAITWGPAPRTRLPRRSIKLGSYSAESRVIRIHPALDQRHVPCWFLGWIVFHEMLHHLHGSMEVDGRRCVHTPAFFADEKRYVHYREARAWEKENISSLLWWRGW